MTGLPDDAVRERIRTDLDTTLFVDAGAGSGKTTVLVDRIVALVCAGVAMGGIAALTFTEKAAAELRDRVREGLEQAGHERAQSALDELDGAALGTLHSFARRVLSEHPIAVGLPPLVEVLDEVGSQVEADRRWADQRLALLNDRDLARTLRLGLAAGMTLEHLRMLVRVLEDNWDLAEERLEGAVPPPVPRLDADGLRVRAQGIIDRRAECIDPGDKLLGQIAALEEWLARATATDDDAQLLDLVAAIPTGKNFGTAKAWGGQAGEIKAAMKALSEDGKAARAAVVDAVVRTLLVRLTHDVLDAARGRVADGRLQFHDLLVLARRLVRSSPDARASLQERYQRLLIDEAQDTDPIQIDLAVRIAGGSDADGPWSQVVVPPGALFFVGDAKQSIYRFRRADVGAYLDAREALGTVVALTTNFRSAPEVLDWVNSVFSRLIVDTPRVQPPFQALDVAPDRARDTGSVTVLGATPHDTTADEVRDREAGDIADLVVTALHDRWTVAERRAGWEPRPIRPDDITILLPARTAITAIEAALDRAGIPFRTEAASVVYSAPEVRELLTCLRAVDDPTDELAVVATLRSGLFGCSDVELWRWKDAGGRWNMFGRREPDVGPVGAALNQLRQWAVARTRTTPSTLLEEVLERRRVLEVAVDSPRYHETWRRLRFVVDQARAWSEAEHGSLREYLAWAGRQADDSARVSETVLPETDTRAVRITTIHASKGLQFPFVIVAGLSSSGANHRPTVLWGDDVEVTLAKALTTARYEDARAVDLIPHHAERLRLLYVACTRAESRLAVSLHRKAVQPTKDDIDCVPAEVLARACAGIPMSTVVPRAGLVWSDTAPAEFAPLPTWEEWSADHEKVVIRSAAREAASATAIAHGEIELDTFPPGLAKDPVDLDLPPWLKGRYGTGFGRAVHGVLQTVDLATGDGLRPLAESQALAEGIAEATDDVEVAVRSILDADPIRRAAHREHWRETYVGTVIDDPSAG